MPAPRSAGSRSSGFPKLLSDVTLSVSTSIALIAKTYSTTPTVVPARVAEFTISSKLALVASSQ